MAKSPTIPSTSVMRLSRLRLSAAVNRRRNRRSAASLGESCASVLARRALVGALRCGTDFAVGRQPASSGRAAAFRFHHHGVGARCAGGDARAWSFRASARAGQRRFRQGVLCGRPPRQYRRARPGYGGCCARRQGRSARGRRPDHQRAEYPCDRRCRRQGRADASGNRCGPQVDGSFVRQ